jgi:hypothetical protein
MVFYNNMLLWHRYGIDKQRSRFTFFLWNVSCYWRRVYAVYADVLLCILIGRFNGFMCYLQKYKQLFDDSDHCLIFNR